MQIKKTLAIWIVGFSIASAILLALWFRWIGEPIHLAVMVWPAIGLYLGLMIAFGNLLERTMNLTPDELPKLLEDDIEALQDYRITPEHLYVAATVSAAIAEIYLLGYYHKWLANWESINVILVGLVVVLISGWWLLRSLWFQQRITQTGSHFYVIAALGWLICISLGVYWAEPAGYGRLSPLEKNQLATSPVYWSSTRSGDQIYLLDFDYIDVFDCDDEICTILILVAIVVLCILGSATIPHFWVVATLLLLTIMTIITMRELLFREGYKSVAGLNSS